MGALLLGAPFWLDLLKKISRLRSSGERPCIVPSDRALAEANRYGTRMTLPSGLVGDAIEDVVDFVESLEAQEAALLS